MPAQESEQSWNGSRQKVNACQVQMPKAPVYRQMGALGWGCTRGRILLSVHETKVVQEEKPAYGCAVDVALDYARMIQMKDQVLVVEDEQAIAAFVQMSLERAGFSVSVARNGEDALVQVQSDSPQLIVLDLMLPGIDGFEVCRRVRRRQPYIPIIMLTSRTDDVDKIVGLELGADDYVTKPFNARELIARIRSVLRLVNKAGARSRSRSAADRQSGHRSFPPPGYTQWPTDQAFAKGV